MESLSVLGGETYMIGMPAGGWGPWETVAHHEVPEESCPGGVCRLRKGQRHIRSTQDALMGPFHQALGPVQTATVQSSLRAHSEAWGLEAGAGKQEGNLATLKAPHARQHREGDGRCRRLGVMVIALLLH